MVNLPLLFAFVGAVPTATCAVPAGSTLLVVTSADPHLRAETAEVERRLRSALERRTDHQLAPLTLVSAENGQQALAAEGGRAARARIVVDGRVRLARAFDRFRELEDSAALELAAEVTARLSAVSQSPGAVELLADAHLLAGAIFLARGRIDAAQARLRRALQLAPTIRAPPTRYAPRVRAELAALRGDPGPLGVLDVQLDEDHAAAQVFVDGKDRGPGPWRMTDIPAGRHLVRVSAPGHQSFHTTVRLAPGQTRTLTARLPVDPEVAQISHVAGWLGAETARRTTLQLLARRAEADTVLLAELRLSSQRGPTATSARAVVLRWGDRPPQTTGLADADLEASLDRLLSCQPTALSLAPAPALMRWTAPQTDAAAFEPPPAWWTRPWVWALFAVAVVGTAGALAATRQAEGPPDEIEITLTPRP